MSQAVGKKKTKQLSFTLHLLMEFLQLHILEIIFLYDDDDDCYYYYYYYLNMFRGKHCQNCFHVTFSESFTFWAAVTGSRTWGYFSEREGHVPSLIRILLKFPSLIFIQAVVIFIFQYFLNIFFLLSNNNAQD